MTDRIYSSLNSKLKTTGLYIDFRKAFDMVDFDILLQKLEYAGVRGNALNWFKTFLVGRRQQVKVGNVYSDINLVVSGVPQGSASSAILFLVFINDLLNLNFTGTINTFADDIAIFYTHRDEIAVGEQINEGPLVKRMVSC